MIINQNYHLDWHLKSQCLWSSEGVNTSYSRRSLWSSTLGKVVSCHSESNCMWKRGFVESPTLTTISCLHEDRVKINWQLSFIQFRMKVQRVRRLNDRMGPTRQWPPFPRAAWPRPAHWSDQSNWWKLKHAYTLAFIGFCSGLREERRDTGSEQITISSQRSLWIVLHRYLTVTYEGA